MDSAARILACAKSEPPHTPAPRASKSARRLSKFSRVACNCVSTEESAVGALGTDSVSAGADADCEAGASVFAARVIELRSIGKLSGE